MALAPPRRLPAALDRSWRRPAALPARDRARLDRGELVLLACFAAASVWMLAFDVVHAAINHRIWTGADGLYVPDQMQYIAWVRDASTHGLASNLFVLTPTPHDYLQPALAISAGLTALGLAPWLALLLWKPIAVLGAFLAVRALVRRLLTAPAARLAALALALFAASFPVIGDTWLPFWSWGYPFGLMAIAALVGALLSYARARSRGRAGWAAPLLGFLATWLHPWQGELLILMIVVAEALDWRAAVGRAREQGLAGRLAAPAITVAATALPLAYYAVLDRADMSWRLARGGPEPHHALGVVLLSLLPLAVFSMPAYRRRPASFLASAIRVWPLAALAVYGLSKTSLGATPLHAFAGISIPLGILAVEGARTVGRAHPRRPALAAAALAAATIPASIYMLGLAHNAATNLRNRQNFITPDMQRALTYLRNDPEPGGVLADWQLGTDVPAETGRRTYVGDSLWSVPNSRRRAINTFNLFEWPEDPRVARAFVLSTGARFVLAGCIGHAGNLPRKLAPITRAVKRFGCMSVYEIA
jgi:hypothetical protein